MPACITDLHWKWFVITLCVTEMHAGVFHATAFCLIQAPPPDPSYRFLDDVSRKGPLPGRNTDRNADRNADRYADRNADRYADRNADRNADRYADRNADRYTDRNTDRYTDRNGDRNADRNAYEGNTPRRQTRNYNASNSNETRPRSDREKQVWLSQTYHHWSSTNGNAFHHGHRLYKWHEIFYFCCKMSLKCQILWTGT